MKKYTLPLTLAANLICSSALADDFYFKQGIGLNHLPNQNVKHRTLNGDDITGKITLKQNFPVIAVGLGYHLPENWRIETALDYYFLFTQAEEGKAAYYNYDITITTQIIDLMLSVYKDFSLTDKLALFGGGGVGVSSIKDDASGYATVDSQVHILQPTLGKSVLRHAFKLSTGVSYKVRESVTCELSYNFYNLGKSKPKLIEGVRNITQRKFLNHNVILGMRISI